ncbi:hypothetical protein [Parasaccharibacter apium]|uniref:hypothetical protein n=1 Tax=Parasaccharibacter apium TaxID=1510841 RepID=UPI0012EB70E0|nr:hypothetical protein [Parasaccharibacter apium]
MRKIVSFSIVLGLAACTHQPVKPVINSDSVLSMTCQSPYGPPLHIEMSFNRILEDAEARKTALQIAAQDHASQLIDFPASIETRSQNLQDRTKLNLTYYPYFNEETGTLWFKGQVTCGFPEGTSSDNQHYYSEGILNMPIQILDMSRPIFPIIQYDGTGGYKITISIEKQKAR